MTQPEARMLDAIAPLRDFVVATISVICMAVPIVVFCAATVITLRSSAAANTLAG